MALDVCRSVSGFGLGFKLHFGARSSKCALSRWHAVRLIAFGPEFRWLARPFELSASLRTGVDVAAAALTGFGTSGFWGTS